jgi:hypothetical protein
VHDDGDSVVAADGEGGAKETPNGKNKSKGTNKGTSKATAKVHEDKAVSAAKPKQKNESKSKSKVQEREEDEMKAFLGNDESKGDGKGKANGGDMEDPWVTKANTAASPTPATSTLVQTRSQGETQGLPHSSAEQAVQQASVQAVEQPEQAMYDGNVFMQSDGASESEDCDAEDSEEEIVAVVRPQKGRKRTKINSAPPLSNFDLAKSSIKDAQQARACTPTNAHHVHIRILQTHSLTFSHRHVFSSLRFCAFMFLLFCRFMILPKA